MDLKGFTNLGKDIGKRVTDAINTGNFSQLNRDVKQTFENAFSEENNAGYNDVLDGKLSQEPEIKKKGFDKIYKKDDEAPVGDLKIRKTWRSGVPVAGSMPGRGQALAMMIAGYLVAAVFGISTIGTILMTFASYLFDSMIGAVSGFATVITAIITIAGLIMGIKGTKRYRVIKRFGIYKGMIKKSSFALIKDMSLRVGKNENFVVRDLTKMIERGYFPEGHIDDHKKYFIGSDDTYAQYLAARDSALQAKEEARVAAEKIESQDSTVRNVILEGKAYINTIRQANDAIYDPVISEKLYRMEVIITKIFDHVENNPEQVGQLRKFMSYYMPTTEKLVKAYQKMDEETIVGQNMSKAKDEIAQTLDTINEAYEKLYDSMHIDIAMDVSSDIAVLKTMFAQEGLSKDELGGK